jgi:hypothetical protein
MNKRFTDLEKTEFAAKNRLVMNLIVLDTINRSELRIDYLG